jgi:Tfp pilus assembly protein PilO
MIAILVTIGVLLGVFYTASLYYPTRKRAKRVERTLAMLEAQLEAVSPTQEKSKDRAMISDALAMDVDFFKKRNLSPRKGIPELLEQINRMGDEMNIRFVTIKPLDEAEAAGYRQYPFLIETKAGYPELVNFVNRIENGMRLSLNNLRIEPDPKDDSLHRLQFELSIFELNDDLDFEPGVSTETVSPLSKTMELVAVDRDPFSAKKATQVAQLPKPPKPAKHVTKKRKLPRLDLMGIMEIAGKRVAIINDRIVRPGEVIHKQKVERIENDRVIITHGDEEYMLFLKGSTPGT